MGGQYILDGHRPVPCNNILEWGRWFEKANRHVANDTKNNINVSTIFLGLDRSFGQGPPILFETMVFGGKHNKDMERYSTWKEAEKGHKKMCEIVFAER